MVQIAGLVARRIVCFSREGQSLGAGERFGSSGSAAGSMCIFRGYHPSVGVGQRAVAGETVLAARGSGSSLSFRSQ